ncbi:MAG: hypothetical protein IAG13_22345, partial [Deltaproteobacteria bacterium]|nr:hypothetical protein [Nannocystaceae bacterium]
DAPAAVAPAPEPPTWRFKHADKPVKVVVLSGSIGAWPKQPYAAELARLCKNVEVHNLSQVGQGAWALKQRFKQQVLGNRRLALKDAAFEHWLVYGGGLNSVGTPKSTNKHVRDLIVLAHVAGVKVVALSVTPWGSLEDKRWRGAKGLEHRSDTREVVDYTMGRLTPEQAFGSYGRKRPGGVAAPWDPLELPDVAVDLYDSPLRDRDAAPRDLETTKAALAKDKQWRQAHAKLDEAARAAQLELDARTASELGQWFLAPELRSFDHTHPNTEGHRIIGATMCPKLPTSWGCSCD